MTTKMLINLQRAGQLRLAIVEGTQLKDYQVEIAEAGLTRGNIYRGVVANIQPSLNAAFIDLGEERHGFLPVQDTLPQAWHKKPPEDEKRPRIDQVLERGRPIYVQVTKDGTGSKGPALTTNLALAGRYLVLSPFDDMRGISRKVQDEEARKKIRERLTKLTLPDGYGAIVRTNGLEQNLTMLNRDLNALVRLWKKIKGEGSRGRGARLLYSDQDLVVQALRDFLDSSIGQVIVDSDEVHEKAQSYMQAFMPRSKTRLVRYTERQPLFSRYALEEQIESIYRRTVPLPSGGSIVIDSTEALTAIDVNSGRATKTEDHDESIYSVNAEAAEEVARQLRLRDIGGLVVVDFIDMRPRKHQRKLEKTLRDAMKADRARYAVGRISQNGLVEINRQRLKQALTQRTHRPCPTCEGAGRIPSPEFAALTYLGRIESRAASGIMQGVVLALHPEIADALQNGHRRELADLEEEFDIEIEVISSASLSRSEDHIEWVRREGTPLVRPKKPALSATDLADDHARRHPQKEDEGDEEDEAAEKKPKRRRRRRRGKGERPDGGASENEAAPAPAPAEKESAAAEEGSDEASPVRRKRRRSKRKKPAGGEAAATTSAPAPKDKPAPKQGEGRTSGRDEEGSSRRRQGQRRRRGGGGGRSEGPPQEGRSQEGRPQEGGRPQEPRGRQDLRWEGGKPPKVPKASPAPAAPAAPSAPSARPAPVVGTLQGDGEKFSKRPFSRWLWWRRGDGEE